MLFKLVLISHCYHESLRGELFLKPTVHICASLHAVHFLLHFSSRLDSFATELYIRFLLFQYGLFKQASIQLVQ